MSLRTEPKSFKEMLDWGMINIKVYNKYKDMPNAMQYVRDNALTYDYFTFGKCHLDEYFKENKIDILEMDVNFFVKYVMKLTQGRINPSVVHAYYKEKQSVEEYQGTDVCNIL